MLSGFLSRAASDRAFRDSLLRDPASQLRRSGVALEGGIAVRAVEPAPGTAYLVLPAPLAMGEVSDEDLARAAGGLTPTTVLMVSPVVAITAIPVATVYGIYEEITKQCAVGWRSAEGPPRLWGSKKSEEGSGALIPERARAG